MPSWTNHTVTIHELTAPFTQLGSSTNVIAAEGSGEVNAVGDGWFTVPASDTTIVALIQKYRWAVVKAQSSVTSLFHPVCVMLILNFDFQIEQDKIVLKVTGPDPLGELRFGTIGFGLISDNAGGPDSDPFTSVLAFGQRPWTFLQFGTPSTYGGLFQGGGEKLFEVLLKLGEQTQANISYSPRNTPVLEFNVWAEHTQTFGTNFDALTLLEPTNPAAYQADASVAILHRPLVVRDVESNVITRLVFAGGGMGSDRITAIDAGVAGLAVLPAGYSLDIASSVLVHTALETTLGGIQIYETKSFSSFVPSDPSDTTEVQNVALALISAAVFYMEAHKSSSERFYTARDLVIHGDITPGQLVHVTYNRESPIDSGGSFVATTIIDLDDDLVVISFKHRIANDGVRYTDLVLGDAPKRQFTGSAFISEKLKQLDDLVNHANAPGGGSDPPSGSSSYLLASGSPPNLSGDLVVDNLVTIDGVDISAHVADFDAHHAPGTLSVNSVNFNNGTETHAVDASSDPGPQAYLLKTDAGGRLVLFRADLDSLVLTDRTTAEKYNVFVDSGLMFIEPV